MEKNLGMIGFGKVTNGVMTFVDASGNGFSKKIGSKETMVTRPVEAFEVPRDIRKAAMKDEVQPLIQMIEKANELDVPAFMKDRKIEPRGQVIYANFNKNDEQESEDVSNIVSDDIADILEEVVDAAKKVITGNRVFKYFFGEDK